MAKTLKVKERKLGRHKALGLAYDNKNLIEIDPRQKPKAYLDTLIHEVLHKVFPELSETAIIKSAKVLCDALWDNNYRKVKQ